MRPLGSMRSSRLGFSEDRRLEVILGAACLILSMACLLLAAALILHSPSESKIAVAEPSSLNQPASETVDDAKLRDAVMQRFQGSTCCDKVIASVTDGVAILNGEVREAVDRDAAAYFAGTITGIRRIHNNIAVDPAQARAAKTAEAQSVIEPSANDSRQTTYKKRTIAREESQQTREANAWIDGGENMLENGDYPRAIEYFNRALSTDPGNARALRGLKRAKAAHEAETAVLRNRN